MRDYTGEDRRVRERLERGSPSATRRDIAGMLNAMAKADAAKEAPGLAAIEAIRDLQKKSPTGRPQTTTGRMRNSRRFSAVRQPGAKASTGYIRGTSWRRRR